MQCERCGGTGQQLDGLYNFKTKKYNAVAGVCDDCGGLGELSNFYKHISYDGFIWVLELIKNKNELEVIAFQYQPNQKCPEQSDTYKANLNPDESHWVKITEKEARELIVNLDEQKLELAHRQSEENINWCKELEAALKCVKSVSVFAWGGVVRITDYKGAEFTISRDRNGKMSGKQTGLPDSW